jgi:hypothetical protein
MREKVGKRWGWRSSPENKAIALGMLRNAYARGRFRNHDAVALDETLTYVHYDGGGIGPATLVTESESARSTHGDRVISDMLCIVGLNDAKMLMGVSLPNPERSIGHRLKQFQKRKKTRREGLRDGTRFDFNTEVA